MESCTPRGPVHCHIYRMTDPGPEPSRDGCTGLEQPRTAMESLDESVSGSTELVFPDDTDGEEYCLLESNVYSAEEVRDELGGDVPQYGSWLKVHIQETERDGWLTAPTDLRSGLVEASIETGEVFRIETMRKRGSDQSDPYLVDLSFPDRDAAPADQESLALD